MNKEGAFIIAANASVTPLMCISGILAMVLSDSIETKLIISSVMLVHAHRILKNENSI